MNEILVCEGGNWTVSGGLVSCNGTAIVSQSIADTFTDQHFITAEVLAAYWPWALLMFATAFGVRLIRRTILSRS